MMMIALEEAVMEIIVNAGQSRSLCFEALHAARQGNIDEAKACCAKPMATRARRTRCRPN
jgi:cellobiose-specific phosphotransferase system component IIA